MKHINCVFSKQIPFAIILSILFYSCGSTKETPYIPSPVENAIHESFKKDDVRELIIHYLNFPNYRNQLAGYLLYDRTYENESYTDLLDYKELALDNTFLSEAFDNIIKQREYQVLTNLSKCSINEIVNYYQSYNDEQCFLRPAIENTLLNKIENYDYSSLRQLHISFKDTDFKDKIDPIYLKAQKSIHAQLNKQLPNYFKKESDLINAYRERTKLEIEQYLSAPIETVIDQMLEKKLPKEKIQINQLFKQTFNNNIQYNRITQIVNNNVNECIELINKSRTYYLNTLMEGEEYYGYNLKEKHINVNFSINNPAHHLYELSKIQNKTDWTGWGLSAASLAANLLSFGTLGNIIDAVDIGRTIKNTKEEIDISKKYIKRFIEALNKGLKQSTQKIVNTGFMSINRDFKHSQNNFKTIIYENY